MTINNSFLNRSWIDQNKLGRLILYETV